MEELLRETPCSFCGEDLYKTGVTGNNYILLYCYSCGTYYKLYTNEQIIVKHEN